MLCRYFGFFLTFSIFSKFDIYIHFIAVLILIFLIYYFVLNNNFTVFLTLIPILFVLIYYIIYIFQYYEEFGVYFIEIQIGTLAISVASLFRLAKNGTDVYEKTQHQLKRVAESKCSNCKAKNITRLILNTILCITIIFVLGISLYRIFNSFNQIIYTLLLCAGVIVIILLPLRYKRMETGLFTLIYSDNQKMYTLNEDHEFIEVKSSKRNIIKEVISWKSVLLIDKKDNNL